MDTKALLKKVGPHIIAIVTFVALSMVYFNPVLQGYKIRQGDITQFQGMSKEIVEFRKEFDQEPLWTNNMFCGMPAYQISAHYLNNWVDSSKNFFKLYLKRPMDNTFLYMIGFYLLLLSFGCNSWLSILGAVAYGFSSYYIVIIDAGHMSKANAAGYMAPVIAGLVYMYKQNKKWVGTSIFGLALALQINSNHLQVTYYLLILIAAYTIFELVSSYQKKTTKVFFQKSLYLIVAGVFAIMANAGNLMVTQEYTKYSTRGSTELTINPDGTEKVNNNTEGLDLDYVTAWSYGKQETFTYLIPNAKGGATGAIGMENKALKNVSPSLRKNIAQSNQYWGNQTFTSGPVYLGAIVCLLFVFGMFFLPSKLKWYLLAVAVIATMLGLGKNLLWLTEFCLNYVPGYNKFRAVTIILILVQFVFPLIGVLWLKHLVSNKSWYQENIKKVYYISGGFLSFILLLYVAPTMFFDFLSEMEKGQWDGMLNGGQAGIANQFFNALQDVRVNIFKADVLRTFFFVSIAIALILVFIKDKIKETALVLILASFILIDLWSVDKRYLNNEKNNGRYVSWQKENQLKNPHSIGQSDNFILSNELRENPKLNAIIQTKIQQLSKESVKEGKKLSNQEKAILPFVELNKQTNYRVLSLNNPFNESRTSFFHKSIGGYHGAKLKRYQELIDFHISSEMKSIITWLQSGVGVDSLQSLMGNIPVLNMLNTKYITYNTEAPALINPNRFGNAWFVNEIVWKENANEEMLALNKVSKYKAVMDTRFKNYLPNRLTVDSLARIKLTSYQPNLLTYESVTQSEQFAVFSEIYYDKGWNAYIDGELVDYVRVNYLLRGLKVPSGKHTIEFRFEPATYANAGIFSLLGSIGILLLVALAIYKMKM